MKLIAQLQLKPTTEQAQLLKTTLEAANAACNVISDYAWKNKEFSQYPLHAAMYRQVRAEFGLAAQLAVRCISKVADAYKSGETGKRTFKQHSAIAYDSRILKYYTE